MRLNKHIWILGLASVKSCKLISIKIESEDNIMKYKVIQTIETNMEDNNMKQIEMVFNTYNQAVFYIKQQMKKLIKQDTIKFFRMYNKKITTEKLNNYCNEDLTFWLENAFDDLFTYVASYIGWSCSWNIEI